MDLQEIIKKYEERNKLRALKTDGKNNYNYEKVLMNLYIETEEILKDLKNVHAR